MYIIHKIRVYITRMRLGWNVFLCSVVYEDNLIVRAKAIGSCVSVFIWGSKIVNAHFNMIWEEIR